MIIGQKIMSNNFGECVVIAKGSKPYYYIVKFLESGGQLEFRKDQILNGQIYDKYYPTVMGVGYLGDINTKKHQKLYNIWKNMICRCYDVANKRYSKNVKVDERWLCFSTFVEDSSKIDGWNEERFYNNEMQLDKDIKQFGRKTRIYSLETCMWARNEINNKIQPSQQRFFEATSSTGEKYIDYNITDFARKYGLERKQISSVLHKRFKTHLGWKFKFIDQED